MSINDDLQIIKSNLDQVKEVGSEITARYCPFCHGGTNRDKNTFSINVDKKTYNCLRGTCGASGTIRALRNFFEPELVIYQQKEYKPMKVDYTDLNSDSIKYLARRGISTETARSFKLKNKDKDTILFPFIKDNKAVFIKYRSISSKKFAAEKDGRPVLFGMQNCKSDVPLVITEGEFDCIAVYESGYQNVVSLPNGVNGFTWVDECWDFIENYDEIILWADNDKAGKKCTIEMIKKLGDWRCRVVDCEYKDANEALVKESKEYVLKTISQSKYSKNDYVIDLSDIDPVFSEGLESCKSNIEQLDACLKGFRMGELTVWAGENESGKSTIINQIMLESVHQDYNVCVFSAELKPKRYMSWICQQIAGADNIRIETEFGSNELTRSMEWAVILRCQAWLQGRMYYYNNNNSLEIDTILHAFEYCARRFNCRVFTIDNLMMITDATEKDQFVRQSNIVSKLVNFCHKMNVHVHLVAHPRKTDKKVTKTDIAGTFNISNKADNVLIVHRAEKDSDHNAEIEIVKNREFGTKRTIGMMFDYASRRVYMKGDSFGKAYYDRNKTNMG